MKNDSPCMWTPFVTIGMALIGGAFLGAVTNLVNGTVSPLYFRKIMGWAEVDGILTATIAQGIFEGLILGLVFGTIFTVATSLISGLRLRPSTAILYVGMVVGSALCAWIIGGILGILLALISPEFYRNTFYGVPEETIQMIAYAWVGGSIWGVQFGGFALLLIWVAIFWSRWRSPTKEANKSAHATARG